MTREDIEQRLIIERYLQGKLTPSEEEAFEETYLGDPELVEQIELTERLRDGLADLALRGKLSKPRRRRLAFLDSPRYAAAASVLLAASLILSTVLSVQNAGLRGNASDVPAFRVEPLFATRGDAHVISRPDEGEWIMLMIDPGSFEYDTFRVTVRPSPPTAAPILQTSGIEPGYEEALAVGVPGERLVPGDYEVVIEGAADGEWRQVTRVSMRVEGDR